MLQSNFLNQATELALSVSFIKNIFLFTVVMVGHSNLIYSFGEFPYSLYISPSILQRLIAHVSLKVVIRVSNRKRGTLKFLFLGCLVKARKVDQLQIFHDIIPYWPNADEILISTSDNMDASIP